jgi:predicted TPR repeat methyltransferase
LARTDDANNAFRLGDTASEQRSTALAASAWDKLAQIGNADAQIAEAVAKLRDLYLMATTDPGSAAPPAHAEAKMHRFETYVAFLEGDSAGLNFCR